MEGLWCRQTGAHDRCPVLDQVEPDQTGLFLEHQWFADGSAASVAERCQDEGRADVGMAGKRHLGAWREDANLGRMGRILWRKNERRLGKIEFGGNGLH